MNDTTPEIAKMVHERYMQMNGQQRMIIGMQMFETARKIVLSSLPQNISEDERKRLLCERFYKEFAEKAFPEKNK
jgi:hypothetical protein